MASNTPADRPPGKPPKQKGFGKMNAAPTPPAAPPKTSKRSTAVTLLALGAGAVTIYAATRGSTEYAYEQTERTHLFSTPAECSTSGKIPALDCETAWKEAQKAHESYAPRFANQSACEAEFGAGKCGAPQASTGGVSAAGIFIPLMAGYALAQATSGYRAQALYQRVGDAPGQYRVSGFVQPPPPQQQQQSSSSSGGSSSSRSWSSSSSSTAWSRSSSPSVSSSGSQSAISRGGFGSTSSAFSSSSSRSSSS